ncbi:MAG: KEOPS complex subunit Cgi121 [Candidatus Thorarchaeota archaeon]
MIIKSIQNLEIGFKGYIGLIEVTIENENILKTKLEDLIGYIYKNYNQAIFQILNNKYILNPDHIYLAYYFTLKAFSSNNNISKSKSIEFLLYLSTNRQIKNAIGDFGVQYDKIVDMTYIICLMSNHNNIETIYRDIKTQLELKKVKFELNKKSLEKLTHIKSYFNITDEQLKVILRSYGVYNNDNFLQIQPIDNLYCALNDLICERMVLISLEKLSQN